jgi:hypothetical protein
MFPIKTLANYLIRYDGFVVLFCLANDQDRDATVDYDELAWELEKCLTYHYVSAKSEIIMNEEACMNRKGLDPVSRKTKTPGRKKAGYCVYIAYQLFDTVTTDQVRIASVTVKHLKEAPRSSLHPAANSTKA